MTTTDTTRIYGDITVRRVPDEDSDPSYLDQAEFAERKLAYERGEFDFIGITAHADILVNGVVQSVQSGGLWSIESNSGEDYLQNIEQEQIAELRDILSTLGADETQ